MVRLALAALVLTAACDHGTAQRDAAPRLSDAYQFPDAAPPPPPSVDAGPPPMPPCGADAGTCQFPPSTCLDPHYLLYYTGGACVNGTCQFTTNLMYCPAGCVNGGCLGGFT